MLPRLIAPAIALLLLPVASATDAPTEPPDSLAVGRVLDPDHVQLIVTFGGQQDSSDVLPLCQDSPSIETGTYVLGSHNTACFQVLHIDVANPAPTLLFSAWATPAHVIVAGAGPGPVCDPVRVTILPDQGPPITPNIDEACIEAIIEHLT